MWTPWWVVDRRASEKYTAYMASSNKESKRNLSESDWEWGSRLPKFIIESLKEVCLAKISPFLIEKVISTRGSQKTIKKTKYANLFVEVDSRRRIENIKNKNVLYDEMQSLPAWETQHFQGSYQQLALATEDEIASALGKKGLVSLVLWHINLCTSL